MAFNAQYQFKVNNTVVIQHRRGGGFGQFGSIRVKADNHEHIHRNGGRAEFAQWTAELKGGNKVMFKSKKGGKYLRITPNGTVNAGGHGGAYCVFGVHHHGDIVKLKNPETGKWLAFNENKGFFAGGGGDNCQFKVLRNAQGGGGQHHGGGGGQQHAAFSQMYQFKLSNTVVIQHRHNDSLQGAFKTVRVGGGDHGLQPGGGKGEFAQFYAEKSGQHFMFKSLKTGKYIRVHQVQGGSYKADCGGTGGDWCSFKVHHKQNGIVMLEGVKSERYLAVRGGEGVVAGSGGPHCRLKFFRK